MSKFDYEVWEDFEFAVSGRELYLFGASVGAQKCIGNIKNKYAIKGVFDNDPQKWGKTLQDIPILSLSELERIDKERNVILITSNFLHTISKQLEALKFKYYFSYRLLKLPLAEPLEQMEIIKIDEVKKILTDERSRYILDQIVTKRRNGLKDYSDICDLKQYFISDLFTPGEKEVIIDGGACDGDTAREFLKWTKGNYKRIYLFEPEESLKTYLEDFQKENIDKIKVIRKGLWSQKDTLHFSTDNECNCITESGASSIEVTSIDEEIDEQVTFIKMDIEGAELKALEGAKKTIVKYKPKMAICIYHKTEDLYEIPLFIHTLVPEYKLAIRHHDIHCLETVLYAYI